MAKTEPNRVRVPVERAIRECRLYVEGKQTPGQANYATALKEIEDLATPSRGSFVLVTLEEPSEEQMLKVAQCYDVDELIVEDAVTAHQRAKLERYENQLFKVVRSVQYAGNKDLIDRRDLIQTGEVQMVISQKFIIVIAHDTELPDPEVRLHQAPELRNAGPMAIAWAITDYLVDEYTRISEALEDRVDSLEEEVFTLRAETNIENIYTLKREILEMRHAIGPLIPALRALIDNHKDLTTKHVRAFFRDVLDHAMLAKDKIDSFDERLSSLIQASSAIISLRQNQDMRTISSIIGMAAPPTMIAGVYGMNFDNMPELHWEYGYYYCLLLNLAVILLMWWWFKRKNWL